MLECWQMSAGALDGRLTYLTPGRRFLEAVSEIDY